MRLRLPTLTVLLSILLPWPAPAAAQPRAEAAPEPAMVHMSYTGSAVGMDVMKLQAAFSMDRAGYSIHIASRTVGLLSAIVRSDQHTTVWGAWRNGLPDPQRFWSWGDLRGERRETLIDYEKGQPKVRTLTPPPETEREKVPEQARGDTIDTLSAVAFLVRRVADTGHLRRPRPRVRRPPADRNQRPHGGAGGGRPARRAPMRATRCAAISPAPSRPDFC